MFNRNLQRQQFDPGEGLDDPLEGTGTPDRPGGSTQESIPFVGGSFSVGKKLYEFEAPEGGEGRGGAYQGTYISQGGSVVLPGTLSQSHDRSYQEFSTTPEGLSGSRLDEAVGITTGSSPSAYPASAGDANIAVGNTELGPVQFEDVSGKIKHLRQEWRDRQEDQDR